MKISPLQSQMNFTGATININALSDTHGHLERADACYQAMVENDVFEKEEDGKANFLIVGGDWFMSGGKKGFLTAPNQPLMKFQADMYNKFVGKIKEKYPLLKSIFVPGNHDLDGGVKVFEDTIRDLDADVVMTNLDFENSPGVKRAIQEGKIVDSKITFVQDDKDETKTHPVLNVGVAPVNLQYYQGKFKDMNLVDDTFTAQKFVKPEQYEKTMAVVREKIDDFKEIYPNGKVILTCHTGVNFAKNCAKLGGIDLIFDAHEHKDETSVVAGTPIVSLSQNFQKVVNAKMELDDDGNTTDLSIREIRPLGKKFKKGELSDFYEELFKEDTKKIYTINTTTKYYLPLNLKGIRAGNSQLANFVTDAILDSIQQIDPSVQIFAINASAIRGGFETGVNPSVSPFEISNCLGGINPNQGQVYTTNVTGRELAMMVTDNFLFNKIDTEKNPIIHYSGLKINKTGFMKAYEQGKRGSDLCKFITLTETGQKIDPDGEYKIANPEKYFIKSANEKIRGLFDKSYPLGQSVHELFDDYFKRNKTTTFTPEERFY